MQPLECRFRLGRAMGEGALLLLATFIALMWAREMAPTRGTEGVALSGSVLLGLCLGWRWRSRFRVDEQGVEFRRTPFRVSRRLEWAEIDELFLLDATQFEVRGAGRVLRFAGPFDNLYSARQACL